MYFGPYYARGKPRTLVMCVCIARWCLFVDVQCAHSDEEAKQRYNAHIIRYRWRACFAPRSGRVDDRLYGYQLINTRTPQLKKVHAFSVGIRVGTFSPRKICANDYRPHTYYGALVKTIWDGQQFTKLRFHFRTHVHD